LINLQYKISSTGYFQETLGNSYNAINRSLPNISYSPIETQSIDNLVESGPDFISEVLYHKMDDNYSSNNDYQIANMSYDVVEMFLAPIRPVTQFINEAWQIKDYIIETFEKLMSRDFPGDIIVKVCDKETMKRIHEQNNSIWKEGILGFAINNRPGNSQIFIMQNNLDRLMLVIGHELGHVLSHRLNLHDEEAKAFAFEFAWAETIKKNNIANLKESIITDLKPAKNGLHDVAWNFVIRMIKNGTNAMQIFNDLIARKISINELYPI